MLPKNSTSENTRQIKNSKNTSDMDTFYSASNIAYIEKSVHELREGKGSTHELIEVYDMSE